MGQPEKLNATLPRLGILISGRGSNMQAIYQATESGRLNACIAVVIASNSHAAGLVFAKEKNLNSTVVKHTRQIGKACIDKAVVSALQGADVDIVILAGYNHIIGSAVLSAFPNRILNIHPSLLPAYGGKGMYGTAVHEAVIQNKETQSGCTVHLVNDVIDGGAILGQSAVDVLPEDTPESLSQRILKEEHQLYPKVIQTFCASLLKSQNSERTQPKC